MVSCYGWFSTARPVQKEFYHGIGCLRVMELLQSVFFTIGNMNGEITLLTEDSSKHLPQCRTVQRHCGSFLFISRHGGLSFCCFNIIPLIWWKVLEDFSNWYEKHELYLTKTDHRKESEKQPSQLIAFLVRGRHKTAVFPQNEIYVRTWNLTRKRIFFLGVQTGNTSDLQCH